MALFVLMILTAFLGYVLPWGQMSYWAATVITNLITSLPVIGQKLVILAHGAFSVQSATLNRFFVLHYLFAIIILILILAHITFLHANGSTSPAAKISGIEKINFYYYFLYKDMFLFFFCVFSAFLRGPFAPKRA